MKREIKSVKKSEESQIKEDCIVLDSETRESLMELSRKIAGFNQLADVIVATYIRANNRKVGDYALSQDGTKLVYVEKEDKG